ncbi:MAG TPA: hydroxyacid dehydrogenase [Verrucomicrobiae bacterium]|jgi:D-3-phosphoglycerate dehydrogenase
MDILITEELDSPAIQKLCAKYEAARDATLWKDPDRLRLALAEARAIMLRNQTRLTADLLAAAPRLLAIGRVGAGLDNIDVAAASNAGVVVIAPLDANATSVAELAIGFVLGLARRIPRGDRSTKSGGWDRPGCTGIELDGKTLALCGFGRVGRKVALLARAFGMTTLVCDPFVKLNAPVWMETGAAPVATLEEALERADFVSVHSPLTPETKGLFNQAAFARMKPGAFFINTSRGGIVDEAALLAALRSGHLGGAALDVRATEPPGTSSGLEQMDNVILAPHVGAFTVEAQTRTMEAVASDVDRVLSGAPAKNFVNMARPNR